MVNLKNLKDGEQTNNNKKDIACSTDLSPALLGSGLAAQVPRSAFAFSVLHCLKTTKGDPESRVALEWLDTF